MKSNATLIRRVTAGALAAADGELELVAVRGTEERTVVARFN